MSIEAHLGKCVHNALEWLYKEQRVPTIDELITYYATDWEENFQEDFVIVNKELTAKDYFNKGVEFLLNYYMQHKPFDDGRWLERTV